MNKDYIFHSYTRSFCSKCKKIIDAKVILKDNSVFILKECNVCGEHMELLETDAKYHMSKAKFDKQGTTSNVETDIVKGCPYDCGLCPSHDQHTCIGLIEITKRCNLECEMCFAKETEENDLTLLQIEKMMDFYMDCENGEAEILQISGGEPTLHKDILEIIKMAKEKEFKYVMLNTNGIRIAEDEEFVKELSKFKGGFEVYLQFDGLSDDIYKKLRHENLLETKKKAIKNLSKYGIPTTLVATISETVNENVIGEIVVYGMKEKCVRGVNFQPLSYYGEKAPTLERATLSSILNKIEKQTNKMIMQRDFIPLPCNVERVAITYLFKNKNTFIPLTRDRDLSEFKDLIGNTFVFTIEETLKDFKEESTIFNMCSCCDFINDIKKYLPSNFIFKSKQEKMDFVDENTFRISVSSFLDIYNFDMKSMKKECVHIITPDLKRVPFSAYNMLHRNWSITHD